MNNTLNISNTSEEVKGLTKKQQDSLFKKVWTGVISIVKLPNFIYEYTFFTLSDAVGVGFGLPKDFNKNTLRFKKAVEFRNNISVFSGAKTFQEVNELSSAVFNSNGTKRLFKEFKEIALKIDETYNLHYLKIEQDMAFAQSQMAEKWLGIEEEKEIFPLLRYDTINDEVVRPEHAAWDGLVFPVDHEFWDTRYPPNDWKCRCTVSQLRDGETSSSKGVKANDSKLFSNNTGKDDYLFKEEGKDKHPYFEIDLRFKKAQENNFGFKTPD